MTIKAKAKIPITASASITMVIGSSTPETSPSKLSYKVLEVSKKRTQSANKSVEAIARKAFVIARMGDAGLKEAELLLATIMQTKFNAETIRIKI